MRSRPLRAWVGGIVHESNSFSPIPTAYADFEPWGGAATGLPALAGAPPRWPGYSEFIGLCEHADIAVTRGIFLGAQPSAPVSASDFARLKQQILDDIAAAAPLDFLLLILHGAQLSHNSDDCEGDLLCAVRALLGRDLPVGVLLDLHTNLSTAMLEHATLLIACKHYPHVDFPERTAEAFSILHRAARGEIHPVTVAVRVPAFGIFATTGSPFDALITRLEEIEHMAGVLSASAMHGFFGGDTQWLAGAILVTTDGSNAAARAAVWDLGTDFLQFIRAAPASGLPLEAALETAARAGTQAHGGRPVVLADRADNAGGGAAGDSTFVLQALLAYGERLRPAALALLWDPVAVQLAHRAGVGAHLMMRLGGKTGSMSGVPLDLNVEVLALRENARQATFSLIPDQPLGRSAVLRVGAADVAVDIVVNDLRQQVFSPHVFTEHGLELERYRVLVVKSTQHFYAAFAPVAALIVRCDTPGTVTSNVRTLPYRRLRRPLWPWDENATCSWFQVS